MKFNCVSLHGFRLYTRHPGESALQLVESADLSTRTLLSDVDPYANLTIGVSLVNSANLESDIELIHYVGSKHGNTSCCLIHRLIASMHHDITKFNGMDIMNIHVHRCNQTTRVCCCFRLLLLLILLLLICSCSHKTT